MNLKQIAKLASIANKTMRDANTFANLLNESGVFGEERETIMSGLVAARRMEIERTVKGLPDSPIVVPQTDPDFAELDKHFAKADRAYDRVYAAECKNGTH